MNEDRPLAERIQNAFFILTMMIVLAIGTTSLAITLLETPGREAEDHTHTLRIISGRLASSIDNFVRDVDQLSRSPLVSTALTDSEGREGYLKPFLAGRNADAENSNLLLLDYRARQVAGRLDADIAKARLREALDSVLHKGVPELIIDDASSRLLAVYPVLSPYDRHAIGVLVGGLDLAAHFRTEVADLDQEHGISLLHVNEVLGRFPAEASARYWPARYPVQLPGDDKTPSLQLEIFSTSLGWLTPIFVQVGIYVLIGIFFGLLVWRLAGRVASSLTQRLNHLAAACADVANGRPFAADEDSAADEIGILSRTLRQALQTQADIHKHLQWLVEQKTEALNESLERYRQAFETNSAVKLMIDPADGRITDANRAAATYYGYTHAQLLSMRISDLNQLSGQELHKEMQQALARNRLYFHFRHRLASGEVRDVEVHSGPVTIGGKAYLHSIIHDVTDRKRAEKQILESEALFRATFEQAGVGVCHAAIDGRFLRFNDKYCAILGYKREQLLGLTFQDVTYEQDLQVDFDGRAALLAGTTKSYAAEKRCLRRDGAIIWVNVTAALVRQANGEPGYILAVVEDIQQRKEMELALAQERETRHAILEKQVAERTAELEAANRQLEGFLYASSHDLKGPLGRISNFSTLLEKGYRDRLEGDGLLFLNFIRENATRLNKLVDDLLNHARIDQQTAHIQPIDLLASVKAVLHEKQEDLQECGAVLHLNLPAVQVVADPYGLSQVLANLLENALKYSAQAKEPIIEIGGSRSEGCFHFWIRDNGIGFDMEYHDRIFEIFRRLHTYAEYSGSGVGLALVKRAMERMRGRVWAESQPGQGATFFLEFLTPDTPAVAHTHALPAPSAETSAC